MRTGVRERASKKVTHLKPLRMGHKLTKLRARFLRAAIGEIVGAVASDGRRFGKSFGGCLAMACEEARQRLHLCLRFNPAGLVLVHVDFVV